ncbi:hypothetical protein RRG08_029294 [Elysia crispata]|uniref:Uncharacterized protein n=1 Tax=Elysia crispata TaxID=231223 RepID=A0AAE1A6Z3_9GAST|nr:hypothetical protein RRG08_029294 [Elysia crispata]
MVNYEMKRPNYYAHNTIEFERTQLRPTTSNNGGKSSIKVCYEKIETVSNSKVWTDDHQKNAKDGRDEEEKGQNETEDNFL